MKKSNKTKPPKNKKRKRDKSKKPTAQVAGTTVNGGVSVGLVDALKTALEFQQAGDLDRAAQFYRKALELEPGNLIAIQLLGGIAQQREEHDEAVCYFLKALEKVPDNAEIRNNLGSSLVELERYEEAIVHLERAVELAPDYALAYNNLGAALTRDGHPEEALTHIRRSVELRPDNALSHNNLGNALKGLERFDEAVEQYNLALKLQPEFPDAYYNLGIAYQHMGLFDEAIGAYEMVLKRQPDYADAIINLGSVYMHLDNLSGAKRQYEDVTELPSALADTQDSNKTTARAAAQLLPVGESWLATANSKPQKQKTASGHIEEAISKYQQAVAVRPDHAPMYDSLGLAQAQAGLLDDAAESFRRAIALDVDFAEAHRNLAIILFMTGDVARGWEEYEWRLKLKESETPIRSFPQAPWDGSPLDGKSILLWGEQGLGDETRFASMIPDVLDAGAAVFIECTPRLVDVFSRSFPQATVCSYPEGDAVKGGVDFQCPFPSLGRFLRPSVEAFSGQRTGYLFADQVRKDFWAGRLADISPRPKIGINWRSMKVEPKWKHYYADVSELAPIMGVAGVDFVNMMYDVTDKELDEFEKLYGKRLLTWDDIDMKEDIDDVAALNASLDMVVSCLSSVSEMSGALGVRTLGFIGDTRESVMLGTGDAIWYPNSAYFSKDRDVRWQRAMEAMSHEIRRVLDV